MLCKLPTQMTVGSESKQVSQPKRCPTATILELIETTDEEMDFLNSPSWQSVLSSDKESASTSGQLPLLDPLFPANPVTQSSTNLPAQTSSLSPFQPSTINPPNQWTTAANPLAAINLPARPSPADKTFGLFGDPVIYIWTHQLHPIHCLLLSSSLQQQYAPRILFLTNPQPI